MATRDMNLVGQTAMGYYLSLIIKESVPKAIIDMVAEPSVINAYRVSGLSAYDALLPLNNLQSCRDTREILLTWRQQAT